jgi:four helix bundle protein
VNVRSRSQSVINGYRDLLVWQRAMDLVIEACGLTKRFPSEEKYALAQQLRRAAVSVPSNIAEGHGRKHLGDYVRHVSIARGSLMEMETQLLIAGRMGYMSNGEEEHVIAQTSEVGRMLSGLLRALTKRYRSAST